MSVGTLPDTSNEYSIPEEPDELVVEIKARANRLSELRRVLALRRIVTEIAEDDPDGLLNTEIALADVWPPTVVVRMWWSNLETLETALESGSGEWVWERFHDGTWGTAFKLHVYTIGKPTASPYSPPIDHEWMQEAWKQTPRKMSDPVFETFANTRFSAMFNERDALGLSLFQWICALYPAFAWSLFAPEMLGIALLPTAIGTVLLAAFFYAACRRATAKDRLRDLSDPAQFNGEDGL